MRLLRLILAIFMMVGLVVIPATSANAVTRYVYVEDHTGSKWPVTVAEPWVDYYTGSVMVYGKCRSGYKCIRVYEKTIRSDWAAVTRSTTTGFVIYINPQRAWWSYTRRLNLIKHELVHAMGYYTHWAYCNDLMYWHTNCPNGSLLLTSYIHSPIRDVLRRN